MYLEHFQLSDYPFRLNPDLDYLYMGRVHVRAMSYLEYSLLSKEGFVVITGEVGSGKTMLLRNLIRELPEQIRLIHIEQTQLRPVELLQMILQGLDGDIDTDNKVELIRRLRACMQKANAAEQRILIAIDEAQGLSCAALEEIRMLSGIESGKEKVLSIMLIGQPELHRLLDSPEMEQLRQRIRLRMHLGGISREEIPEYVEVRLRTAGAPKPEDVLDRDAYEILYQFTGGIPRVLNSVMDMALLTASIDGKFRVDAEVLQMAINELGLEPYRRYAATPPARTGTSAGGQPTSLVPASQVARLTDSLDGINRTLGRIERALAGKDTGAARKNEEQG